MGRTSNLHNGKASHAASFLLLSQRKPLRTSENLRESAPRTSESQLREPPRTSENLQEPTRINPKSFQIASNPPQLREPPRTSENQENLRCEVGQKTGRVEHLPFVQITRPSKTHTDQHTPMEPEVVAAAFTPEKGYRPSRKEAGEARIKEVILELQKGKFGSRRFKKKAAYNEDANGGRATQALTRLSCCGLILLRLMALLFPLLPHV